MPLQLSAKLIDAIERKPEYRRSRQIYQQANAFLNSGRPYRLGYWLDGIDDSELVCVNSTLNRMSVRKEVSLGQDDLLLACVVAYCAELNNFKLVVPESLIKKLLMKMHDCVKAEISIREGQALSLGYSCIDPAQPVPLALIDGNTKGACFAGKQDSGRLCP